MKNLTIMVMLIMAVAMLCCSCGNSVEQAETHTKTVVLYPYTTDEIILEGIKSFGIHHQILVVTFQDETVEKFYNVPFKID